MVEGKWGVAKANLSMGVGIDPCMKSNPEVKNSLPGAIVVRRASTEYAEPFSHWAGAEIINVHWKEMRLTA
jgi:hypothetical protein